MGGPGLNGNGEGVGACMLDWWEITPDPSNSLRPHPTPAQTCRGHAWCIEELCHVCMRLQDEVVIQGLKGGHGSPQDVVHCFFSATSAPNPNEAAISNSN